MTKAITLMDLKTMININGININIMELVEWVNIKQVIIKQANISIQ